MDEEEIRKYWEQMYEEAKQNGNLIFDQFMMRASDNSLWTVVVTPDGTLDISAAV